MKIAFILIICITVCACTKVTQEVIVEPTSDKYLKITEIFSLNDFEVAKTFILTNGNKGTYRNFDGDNPHYSFDGFEAYLNAEIGQRNINNDPAISDFNQITIRDRNAIPQYYTIHIVRKGDNTKEGITRPVEGMWEERVYLLNPYGDDINIMKNNLIKYIEVIKNQKAQKYFNPIDLLKLCIDSAEMPTGFVMNQNILSMPGTAPNEQIYQYWRIDAKTNQLALLESNKKAVSTPISASSDQIWYRTNTLGGKDKIEINRVICTSEPELLKTVNQFTKETYQAVFILSAVPFAGEKSWVPMDAQPTDDSFSLMFYKHNVFIRLYVRISNKDAIESQHITEMLAKQLVNNIDSFAVNSNIK